MFKMLSITSIFHCVIPEIAKIHCSQPVKRRRIQLQESPLFHDAAETLFICSFSFESTSFIFFKLFAISVKFGIKTLVLSSNTKVFVVLRLL